MMITVTTHFFGKTDRDKLTERRNQDLRTVEFKKRREQNLVRFA